jgi:AI-2 transport protein TqsA
MAVRLSLPMLRLLEAAACLVIILWGIRAASDLIGLVLLGILLACVFLPFPEWLMERFKLGKSAAIGLTVASLGTLSLVTVFYLYERISHLREKLPTYQEHFMLLYEKILVFLNTHGINLVSQSSAQASSSERFLEVSRVILPEAGRVLSDGLLVSVLGLIFLIVMVEGPAAKRGRISERLHSHSVDVRRYIAISAKTGGIIALANLVLLLLLGVDFAVLWCVLYFFLRFIPNLGFILAILPPIFVALLMSGWQRALLVAGGLILTNLVADYVLNPIFMKKGVDVSFVEITFSLLFWGYLLGPVGAVLGIPLTVALRKAVSEHSREGALAGAQPE